MKKIIVIGSSNVDTTLHVKDFPKPGETINANKVTVAGGGKGANQAIAATKSGADCYFISRVGDDSFADFLLAQLQKYGVKTDYVQKTANTATGQAYITLNEAGQNDIIIDHGANYELKPEDIERAEGLIADAECIIAQFETPLASTLYAFKLAKANGVMTILNPAPAIEKIPRELLEVTDVITPNETESALITGIKIESEADLAKNAAKLHELGVENVIITYGDKGAYIATPKVEKLVPAFKVKAVDTTAAGDTFLGFLAGSLDTDLANIEKAATIASKASSLAVQKLGAQPSIPSIAEVEEALR
ncbi:ribokinase [Lactobacillus gigeriorum]|uniref:Ribokinase n=1 Tax=Lactobacillus gigeriorum DSM 23908 = CRBIP 24.85 TaxID=1423751 RepID=I7KPS4_9LACO|nr:ribokinase [Lactobacillus gigeriorum]KRN11785.1 ribokinase [Lactobacillus gigeriorum DSM 23908 = CRBIP 24.85]CCI87484.1 Ribokinase [Lactobacillus gigeriorum DSM 23908 = CRBIP 24.85]